MEPVQPNHEALEYLPTQAVAEYVVNVLGFDGIRYASAQHSSEAGAENDASHNVAIFQKEVGFWTSFSDTLKLDTESLQIVRVDGVSYAMSNESLPMSKEELKSLEESFDDDDVAF